MTLIIILGYFTSKSAKQQFYDAITRGFTQQTYRYHEYVPNTLLFTFLKDTTEDQMVLTYSK